MFHCELGQHSSKSGEPRTLITFDVRRVENVHGSQLTVGTEIAREVSACPVCLERFSAGEPLEPVVIGTKRVVHPAPSAPLFSPIGQRA